MKIVTYHYVRPIKHSPYPRIKGLELDGFRRQIDYFKKHYEVMSAQDVIDIVKNKEALPKDAVWLTFDDGYKEHVTYVLPELVKRGLTATFFPPAKPIMEKKLLDVNAIHYILACSDSNEDLINELHKQVMSQGIDDKVFSRLWDSIDKTSRYDSEKIIVFKKMLQRELPESTRAVITKNLFESIVKRDEKEFCEELYLSSMDVCELISSGMTIGSHTYSHRWLNYLNYVDQEKELLDSLNFMESCGVETRDWIMCYPYGGYDKNTIDVLRKLSCAVAVTTVVGDASLEKYSPYELPRFDTNDFPQ